MLSVKMGVVVLLLSPVRGHTEGEWDKTELERRAASHGHRCGHDRVTEVQEGHGVSHVTYAREAAAGRRGAPATRQNLRIKWFWGDTCKATSGAADLGCYCVNTTDIVPDFTGQTTQSCSGDNELWTSEKRLFVDKVMTRAVEWIHNALLVDAVVGTLTTSNVVEGGVIWPLRTPYCGLSSWNNRGVLTDPLHHDPGVSDADVLIYMTAVPSSGSETAWAAACMLDQYNRPIAGQVNWNPVNIDVNQPADSASDESVGVAIHEIFHVLGFSSTFWGGQSGWFEAYCLAKGEINCAPTISVAERGQTDVMKMATPEVLSKLREYSGCDTLNGGEIENEGGSGTKGSHWEKRLFQSEAMTGSYSTPMDWSAMTLAYFKDTGIYDVNYNSISKEFSWGKGRGCSWWTESCNNTPASSEWCFPADPSVLTRGCDWGLTSAGMCYVGQYSDCLDPHFQYYSGCNIGGGAALMDYCPTWIGFSNTLCTDAAHAITGTVTDADMGDSRAANSRCFESNLMIASHDTTTGRSNQRCFKVECSSDCSSYTIVLANGDEVVCTQAGAPTYPAGFNSTWRGASGASDPASITCWPVSDLCGESARARLGAVCTPAPSASPTARIPTQQPTSPPTSPSVSPTTSSPSGSPVTSLPSESPSLAPLKSPTSHPSQSPTSPTLHPVQSPTQPPTSFPSTSASPSVSPVVSPPSVPPTVAPSRTPTVRPSPAPSSVPTTASPSASPSTSSPSGSPTLSPSTLQPTSSPSASPVSSPPSASPATSPPSRSPTFAPLTSSPSRSPVTSSPSKSPLTSAPLPATSSPTARVVTAAVVQTALNGLVNTAIAGRTIQAAQATPAADGSVSVKATVSGDVASFDTVVFVNDMAAGLAVSPSRITSLVVTPASIIVAFAITNPNTPSSSSEGLPFWVFALAAGIPVLVAVLLLTLHCCRCLPDSFYCCCDPPGRKGEQQSEQKDPEKQSPQSSPNPAESSQRTILTEEESGGRIIQTIHVWVARRSRDDSERNRPY
eukprot:Hpha_TRINITY_DN16831_c1_g6::TRINITY_DN16831_c1_g6_i1::g.151771::m.151771